MAESTVGGYRSLVVAPSTTVAVAGTGTITPVVIGLDYCVTGMFWLNVTAGGTAAGDLLDVWLQKTWDQGTSWTDFARFTQVLGNAAVKNFLAEWSTFVTPEAEQAAPSDGAMAAGVTQGGTLGPQIRTKYTVTEAATATFTFTVLALLAGGRQV